MSHAISSRETRDAAREIKFLIDADQAGRIREWARARLSPDPYAAGAHADEYSTTTLYFDTTAFDVFHRRGSYGRSKYRIRRYGAADVVFLERKLRTSTLLNKRRTIVALDGLRQIDGEDDPTWPGRWFRQRIEARRVGPTVQVAYHRTARVGLGTWGPMRLTLDDQIRGQAATRLAFQTDLGIDVSEHDTILELKFRFEMPAVFRHLVEEFALQPAPVSKYRLTVARLGLASQEVTRG